MTQKLTPSFLDYAKVTLFEATPIGLFMIVGAGMAVAAGTFYAGSRILDHYYPEQNQVIQQNVLGNEKPETYVEVNGVKYYSHVDGKEISDLVKE